jgi:sec-independent protein translocase protein TatC
MRLTLAEHLDELRRRLAVCLVAVALGSGVGFAFAGHLLELLKRPAGVWLPHLAFFSPTEALFAYVRVAVTFGIVVALPVLLYEVWAFIESALTRVERFYGLLFVWLGSLLFAGGVAFAYAALLPVSLRVLLTIGGPSLMPMISVSRYLSFALGLLIACGAVFELPLVIVLLAKLGAVTPQLLRQQRGLAIVIILVVAALLTPTTDALSLLLMALPLLALYELSILLARLVRPPHALHEAAEQPPHRR